MRFNGLVQIGKDGQRWRIGTSAQIGWIANSTTIDPTITSAIPPVFEAYATFWESEDAAGHYADVVWGRDQNGMPIDGFDTQIAALCRSHGAALATRNLKGFRHTGINLIDPWHVDG